MSKYYLATAQGCTGGFQIMRVSHDKDGTPHWDVVKDDKDEELVFEFLVDARDYCVKELGYDPSPKDDEASWEKMREDKEAKLRRQRHEDLPLFRKDKKGD